MQFDNSLQMMKRFLILCCAMMVGALGAQKSKDIGFVDSDVILAKMPEYRAAQKIWMIWARNFKVRHSRCKQHWIR